jgi:hypothetical protein
MPYLVQPWIPLTPEQVHRAFALQRHGSGAGLGEGRGSRDTSGPSAGNSRPAPTASAPS